MNRSILIAVVLAVCMAFGGQAMAHAHLVQATPAADAIVQNPPTALELRFSEGVEAKFTKIEITDGSGKDVPIQSIASGPGDKKILVVTPTSPFAAGTYKIVWRAISVDTHASEGSYSFTIQP